MSDIDPITKMAQNAIDDQEKYPKSTVNYRPADVDDERCGLCEYFVDEESVTSCKKVEGEIKADYTCKLFEPRESEEMADEADDDSKPSAESEQ